MQPPRQRRQLNVKGLAFLMVLTLVLGVGVHFLHAFQVERGADALSRQAEDAEKHQDLARAVKFLDRYLRMRPEDTARLEKYGTLLDKFSQDPPDPALRRKAFFTLEQVLLRRPDKAGLRRRQVDRAMALGRYPDAIYHLGPLLKASPEDIALLQLRARCEEAARRYKPAAYSYELVVGRAPHNLEAYRRLAVLYSRHLNQPDLADKK